MRHRLAPLALIAGTLVPAIGASGISAHAQLVPPILGTTTTTAPTTTTTAAPTTTTTTTAAPTTTTTAAATTTSTSTTTSSTTTTVTALEDASGATQSLTGGSLSITAPSSASLSSRPTGGGTITSSLGEVTVTDGRGIGSSWTATVTSTSFTTGGASSAETIDRSLVSYWSGPATRVVGLGTASPGQLTSAGKVTLSQVRTAFGGAVAGVGEVSVSWNPTLVVTIPNSAVAGVYNGTVTHSVA